MKVAPRKDFPDLSANDKNLTFLILLTLFLISMDSAQNFHVQVNWSEWRKVLELISPMQRPHKFSTTE